MATFDSVEHEWNLYNIVSRLSLNRINRKNMEFHKHLSPNYYYFYAELNCNTCKFQMALSICRMQRNQHF